MKTETQKPRTPIKPNSAGRVGLSMTQEFFKCVMERPHAFSLKGQVQPDGYRDADTVFRLGSPPQFAVGLSEYLYPEIDKQRKFQCQIPQILCKCSQRAGAFSHWRGYDKNTGACQRRRPLCVYTIKLQHITSDGQSRPRGPVYFSPYFLIN